MVKNFTITVTDPTGAKHYEFRSLVRTILRYGVLSVLGIGILGMLIVVGLHHSVNNLESRKDDLNKRLTTLQEQNRVYQEKIRDKTEEFHKVHNKVAFIESLVGIESDQELSLPERMHLATQALNRRELEFKKIGDRVGSLEDLIGMENTPSTGKNLTKRLELASLTATQKKSMLNTIPSGYPVKYRGITSKFGLRFHPKRKRKAFHGGLDLRAGIGTPVHATSDAVVEFAGEDGKSGFGVLVILRHNFGFRTYYGHLNKVKVKSGDFVKKGQLVALSGNSGLSSGPHLHYEVRFLHTSLNPINFVRWGMKNYNVVFKEKRVKWRSLVSLVNQRLTNPAPQSLQLALK
ncbi:MAG: peptidoglycan DD-metalloendopeptidase family protein [Magnetococcales bacterium]|nr:peptidoglycan DD-metalloendopeptidase family protein [Magnetococcales bacterium]